MSEPEPVVNALSFDLEEWFQAEVFAPLIPPEQWESMESRSEAQVDFVLGVLEEYGVRATFFTLGWLAERRSALVEKIAGAGHEIACHGYAHAMITRQCRGEFDRDIKRSKKLLEDLWGKEIRGYRAPTFSITKDGQWAIEVLWENGFYYDSSSYTKADGTAGGRGAFWAQFQQAVWRPAPKRSRYSIPPVTMPVAAMSTAASRTP